MRASAEGVTAMRERAREVMGGEMQVQEWEIAVMHRKHEAPEGACTRVVWSKADVDHVDRVLDAYRLTLVPQLDRKSTRLNSSHANISYAVFCLKKKKINSTLIT